MFSCWSQPYQWIEIWWIWFYNGKWNCVPKPHEPFFAVSKTFFLCYQITCFHEGFFKVIRSNTYVLWLVLYSLACAMFNMPNIYTVFCQQTKISDQTRTTHRAFRQWIDLRRIHSYRGFHIKVQNSFHMKICILSFDHSRPMYIFWNVNK